MTDTPSPTSSPSASSFWTQCVDFAVAFSQVPSYHLLFEGFLISWVIWLLVRRVSNRNKRLRAEKLTKEEEEELLAEWTPEPLVPEVDPNHPALHVPVVEGKPGKMINIDGRDCLNLATHNYLGFAGNEAVEKSAIECIRKFGVGSCGPRAFYGTADIHVYLEEKLAAFFGAEQAVLYSYGFSTIASAIPAYAKKGDIIFVDECVNFAIQKGLDASRSKIKYFRHNDVEHLRHLLEQQALEDKKHPKQAKVSRRFLIVEGIYMNTGTLCNIDPMLELKRQYKLRLFIDESVSFGTLGEHGKGITEYKNISMDDIDLIMATLEYAIGSIGGFCVGTTYVVEHQTLAGLGYCFSASLPPMLAAGAFKAIEMMEEDPSMFGKLRELAEEVHNGFEDIPGLELIGEQFSPVKHLRLKEPDSERETDKAIVNAIILQARAESIALVMASYLEDAEAHLPPVSIRLTCSTLMALEDVRRAAITVRRIAQDVFKNIQANGPKGDGVEEPAAANPPGLKPSESVSQFAEF
eukprot:maker-scaffold261_size233860-snap-gene-1.28 protein:Tk10689 transcript:maker-scaffold261_size233860-snap-gene-1.28-mRNA-1 annotation:"hypothetical protein DAPPUDRAFT_301811"